MVALVAGDRVQGRILDDTADVEEHAGDARHRSARDGAKRLRGHRLGGHVAQGDGHAERAQAVHALQLFELDVLDLAADVAEVAQVLEIAAILRGLAALAVYDGELARLRHALGRALDQGLVDALFDDLVADVVGAVDVEALLVEAEADRHRRVLHEHEVRGVQRHRQLGGQPVGARGDAAHDHELPDAQALEIERVEATVLDERTADVDLVVDAVGLLLLEVVREDVLRCLLLEVEIRGDRVADARDALLEHAALAVDGTEPRVEARAVRRDLLAYSVAERPEM